jgi:hypothetical protein
MMGRFIRWFEGTYTAMSNDGRVTSRLLDITPLRQGLALVWRSGRGWTVTQIALLVLAGWSCSLALYLTRRSSTRSPVRSLGAARRCT